MYALEGKVAIVTGGASGIGHAISVLLAKSGAAVVVADLNEVDGLSVVDEITQAGRSGRYVHCNVSSAADCQQVVETAIDSYGRVDILVNNAGIVRRANVLDTSEEEWDQVMAVNVKGTFLMSKYAIRFMQGTCAGVIVNISSGWGLVGGKDALSYCASKAAVVNMTRAMALDHGEGNIRVNCVCPGDTDTPMLRNEAGQLGESKTEFLAKAADRPLGRIGTPEEIAQAVLYLCSDASSFVTGSVLVVDGGGLAG